MRNIQRLWGLIAVLVLAVGMSTGVASSAQAAPLARSGSPQITSGAVGNGVVIPARRRCVRQQSDWGTRLCGPVRTAGGLWGAVGGLDSVPHYWVGAQLTRAQTLRLYRLTRTSTSTAVATALCSLLTRVPVVGLEMTAGCVLWVITAYASLRRSIRQAATQSGYCIRLRRASFMPIKIGTVRRCLPVR